MSSTFINASACAGTGAGAATCCSFIHHNLFFNFPNQRKSCTKKLPIKSTKPSLTPLSISSVHPPLIVHLLQSSKTPKRFEFVKKSGEKNSSICDNGENVGDFAAFVKPLVYTLFCVAVGLCPVLGLFGKPPVAVAATGVVESEVNKMGSKLEQVTKSKGHEYSHCTERLLETVSGLVRAIEEVRRGESDVKVVEERLKEVRMRKKELQDEIMNGLYADLRLLRGEKQGLVKRADEVYDSVLRAKREEEGILRKGKGSAKEVKGKIGKLEEGVRDGERKYNEMWERIGEIEDQITRRETLALSIGVRELLFIERECEQLVAGFRREARRLKAER